MEAPRDNGCGFIVAGSVIAIFVGCIACYWAGIARGIEQGRPLGVRQFHQQAVEAGAAEWVVEGGEVTGVKWRGKQ